MASAADQGPWDLVVCGAGPAGAVAAAAAARGGLRVALLEKCHLPRHKPCGGGMPVTVARELTDLAPEAVVETRVRAMRHSWCGGEAVLAGIDASGSAGSQALWMVQRPRFDLALVERAVAAGAVLLEGHALTAIHPLPEGRCLSVRRLSAGKGSNAAAATDRLTLTARTVIGADGAAGIVAAGEGLRRSPRITLAMEVEVPHRWDPADPLLRPDVLHLDYGLLRQGYAWAFPKADHLNIGAGVFYAPQRDVRRHPLMRQRIRAAIEAYACHLGVASRLEGLRFHGHPLPVWDGHERLHSVDGRVLLAGDAAGLINPLFGDGLLHAIRSGALAADCVLRGDTLGYSRAVRRRISADFPAARRLSWLLRGLPRPTWRHGLRDPRLTPLLARLLAGELEFRGLGGRAARRLASGLLGRGGIAATTL